MIYKTRKREAKTNSRARSLRRGGNMAEALLWDELKDRKLDGYKFVRQFPIGVYFADFLCREMRLVVEVDGSQHADSAYDSKRDEYMRGEGYSTLRVWNTDVLKRRGEVCDTILVALRGGFSSDIATADLRYVRAND
ncbi:MAG: endonuclease domain-containing protein [Rhizobiaceae bacterium]|jgi:very-short-patch-repair endonuclease|nr:endonuclease domain-containing protein [Rhizobiaceae bacterium]